MLESENTAATHAHKFTLPGTTPIVPTVLHRFGVLPRA